MLNQTRCTFAIRGKNACIVVTCAAFALTLSGCSKQETAGKPESLIETAWRDFQLQDFRGAAANFKQAIHLLDKVQAKNHPLARDHTLRLNALYGLGLVGVLVREGGPGQEEGRRLLQQVIAEEGHGEMAAWAALALVREEHLPQTSTETIDIPKLRKLYRAMIDAYPDSRAAQEAFLYLQSLYVETLDTPDAQHAVDAIKNYLAAHAAAPFRSALYTLSSQAHVTLKDYPAALADAINALDTKEIDPSNPTINNVLEYYRIGLMAQYDVGDFATARKYYGKLLTQYPLDQRVFTVKLELKRMGDLEAHARLQPAAINLKGGNP